MRGTYAFIHSVKPPRLIMNKSGTMLIQATQPRTENEATEDHLNALVGTTSAVCPVLSVEYSKKKIEHTRRITAAMDDRNENGIVTPARQLRSLLSI